MKPFRTTILLVSAMLLLLAPAAAFGETVTLQAVQFPEGRDTDIKLTPVDGDVPGRIHGEVDVKRGRAMIELEADDMKPALALGGDVTSYVVWAVPRSGNAENLGELPIRDRNERFHFSSGLKEFAIMVTAEMHPQVEMPSSLLLFHNQPADGRWVKNKPFSYSSWTVAPVRSSSGLVNLSYDEEKIDVMQARQIFTLAESRDAERYAPERMREARVALGQAENFLEASKEKKAVDFAHRATAHASEALLLRDEKLAMQAQNAREAAAMREREALKTRAAAAEMRSDDLKRELTATELQNLTLRQQIAEREERLTVLAQSAAALAEDRQEAETKLQQAEMKLESLDTDRRDAREEAARLESERNRLSGVVSELAARQAALEADRTALAAEKSELESKNEMLAAEKAKAEADKDALAARNAETMADLKSSLSKIADTRSTARGLVVSLPDILFDVDKATLKPEATTTLAKLAGVLILVPDLELAVEGHTDSTGTEAHNQQLSQARAKSVSNFLIKEGIDSTRLEVDGFGESQPIADNSTRDGRQQNRRVEVIIERMDDGAMATAATE